MVLLGEFGEAELVIVWIAEIFFRENLAVILHALSLVDHLTNLTCLYILSFVLLCHDIFLDAIIDFSVVCLMWLETFAERLPVLYCANHMIGLGSDKILIILDSYGRSSGLQSSLVVIDQRFWGIQLLL